MNGFTRICVASSLALALSACGQGAPTSDVLADVANGRVVYKVSADGQRLEGYSARDRRIRLGSVALPPGAVWSVANGVDGRQIWIHGRDAVILVDTRNWKEVGRWARAHDNLPMLADRHQVGEGPRPY